MRHKLGTKGQKHDPKSICFSTRISELISGHVRSIGHSLMTDIPVYYDDAIFSKPFLKTGTLRFSNETYEGKNDLKSSENRENVWKINTFTFYDKRLAHSVVYIFL